MTMIHAGPAVPILLLTLVLGACTQDRAKGADPPGADGVDDERTRVENGLMQAVIFEGEDNTASVADRMAFHNVPGMAFALIDEGRVAWTAGYGVLEAGSAEPVTPETLFQAASVAKPVVASAVMRMYREGVVDMDADVHAYLSDYRLPDGAQGPGNPVTLRKLLSHTAGLTPGGYMGYAPGDPVPGDLEILRGLPPSNSPPVEVVSPPGSNVAYSGGGYTLVELLVQDVTGISFPAAMDRWILEPMSMAASTFAQPLPTDRSHRAATGHLADGSPLPGRWRIHPEQAAAGLWTTVRDLASFAVQVRQAYLRGTDALDSVSAVELLTEQLDGEGVGFVVESDAGATIAFSHAGGNMGYRAYMTVHIPSGTGAVFMTNGDQGMAVGHELLRAASAAYGWSKFKPQTARRASVEARELPPLLGTYDFGDGVRVVIGVEDDSLLITFPNGDMYALVPTGAQEFVAPETGLQVTFGGTDNRRILTVYGDQGVRLEPPPGG